VAAAAQGTRLIGVAVHGRVIGVLLCAAVLNVTGMRAQTETKPADPPAIDPTKLGVSFDRVRMQLARPATSKTTGLKIQETIEVVGKAPKPLIWNPQTANLKSAAVPFGAPTQRDIQKLIVPKEFQTYPFDLNALMQWLMEHLNKKTAE
jgi:hypothetical protein